MRYKSCKSLDQEWLVGQIINKIPVSWTSRERMFLSVSLAMA